MWQLQFKTPGLAKFGMFFKMLIFKYAPIDTHSFRVSKMFSIQKARKSANLGQKLRKMFHLKKFRYRVVANILFIFLVGLVWYGLADLIWPAKLAQVGAQKCY